MVLRRSFQKPSITHLNIYYLLSKHYLMYSFSTKWRCIIKTFFQLLPSYFCPLGKNVLFLIQMANSFDEVADSSADEDTLFLVDTAFENSRSFAECWHRHTGASDFLTGHDYIPIRATSVSQGVDQEELWH